MGSAKALHDPLPNGDMQPRAGYMTSILSQFQTIFCSANWGPREWRYCLARIVLANYAPVSMKKNRGARTPPG